jgi:hypothetical protein
MKLEYFRLKINSLLKSQGFFYRFVLGPYSMEVFVYKVMQHSGIDPVIVKVTLNGNEAGSTVFIFHNERHTQ